MTSRAAFATGGALACGAAAAIGLTIALGPPAVALCLLLASGSPPVLARYLPPTRRHRRSASATPLPEPMPVGKLPPTRHDPMPPDDVLAEISTRQLCRDWRASYTALQRSCDPAAAARLVHTRLCYLNEMERRDRAGFKRWIDSGARAAGDPGTYLLDNTSAHDHPVEP